MKNILKLKVVRVLDETTAILKKIALPSMLNISFFYLTIMVPGAAYKKCLSFPNKKDWLQKTKLNSVHFFEVNVLEDSLQRSRRIF